MLTNNRRTRVHYSPEIKLEAVRLFYEEGYTRKEIVIILGVKSPENVKRWLREYRQEGEQVFQSSIQYPKKEIDPRRYIKQLEMENELLKKCRSELCKSMLAKRNIGQSTITEGSTP